MSLKKSSRASAQNSQFIVSIRLFPIIFLMLLSTVTLSQGINAQKVVDLYDDQAQGSINPTWQELIVMTFNVHAGSDAPIDTIAKIMNDANPDFVALQEIDVFTHRKNAPLQNGRNMIADLAGATGMFALYGRTLNFAGGYYGIGLLSKYPCVRSEVLELPNPDNYEPRVVLEGEFLINGNANNGNTTNKNNNHENRQEQKVVFACTHLCVEDSLTRALQAEHIVQRYSNAEIPVIIGGDFNSLPQSEPIRILEEAFCNISGTDPTFPSTLPKDKLDYVFGLSTSPMKIISTSAIENLPWASDHRPVVAKVKIKE